MHDDGNPADPALARSLAPITNITVRAEQAPLPEHVSTFSDFYREFVPALVAFLMWQGVRQLSDAADIAQEAMVKAYQHWDRIDQPKAWVRTVASREYARRIARIEEDPVDDVPEVSPLLRPDVDETAFAQRHEVLQLLALLPPRQRQVMAWTYDGYAPTQIADELAMTADAVRGSLVKARRALARHLAGRQADDS